MFLSLAAIVLVVSLFVGLGRAVGADPGDASTLGLGSKRSTIDLNTHSFDPASKLGISADSGQSFDQLKYKYMAAMLGERYAVNVDSGRLASAIENDSLPFYILQWLPSWSLT